MVRIFDKTGFFTFSYVILRSQVKKIQLVARKKTANTPPVSVVVVSFLDLSVSIPTRILVTWCISENASCLYECQGRLVNICLSYSKTDNKGVDIWAIGRTEHVSP